VGPGNDGHLVVLIASDLLVEEDVAIRLPDHGRTLAPARFVPAGHFASRCTGVGLPLAAVGEAGTDQARGAHVLVGDDIFVIGFQGGVQIDHFGQAAQVIPLPVQSGTAGARELLVSPAKHLGDTRSY